MKWTAEQIEAARANLTPAEQEELDAHLSQLADGPPEGLMDFIPWLSPKFQAPHHLEPLIEALERSRKEPIRLVVSVSPRMGKTETLLHYLAWCLSHDPSEQIAYISHTDRLAKKKAAKARQLAAEAGVPISKDTKAKSDWTTGVGDGGVWATSTGGAIVGLGFTKILVDDPVKGRADAESPLQRENDWEWFNGDLFNRLEPNGSVIVNMARWHPDDLSGRLIEEGWEYINLAAITDEGESLWPERWPLERLMEIKEKSEYDWLSLYMGTPRARSGAVFEGVTYYQQLPPQMTVAIGTDLAYSAKTHADWSVAVVLGEYNGDWYVLDVIRKQVKADVFADDLIGLQKKYPGAPVRWHCSTTEMGTADLMRKLGVNLWGVLAQQDKFIRAQPLAVKWKNGKILVPQKAPWLADYLAEMSKFTGISDPHDDLVDATSSAFSLLPGKAVVTLPQPGTQEFAQLEARKMLEQARRQVQKQNNQKARDPFGYFNPR